jgi:hypothetical protein
VVVVEPGVVLFGSKEIVEAALAGVKTPAPLPAALTLTGDQQLVFRFNVPNPEISASGALRVSPERFRLEADVDVPTDEMAAMAERKLQQAREQAAGLQQAQPDVPVAKLLSAFDLQRHGRHFTSAFELREPVVEQARHLGVLLGMTVYGVRRYMQDAKSAEAHAVMSQIARNYSAVMQEPAEKGKRARPKKLVSLPAVPASVPRGVKYQSSPDDWKAWSSLHFTMSDPQFFQYEVVAAKDGKTAEILARGDLNGDGKTSLYRLKIALDPKTGAITAVEHSEQDPLE